MPDDKPMQYRIVDNSASDAPGERRRVVDALLETPARIEPRYFYDDLGCALYVAICRLPEYYLTRTELALFREHRDAIAEAAGRRRQFVDLGAGDGGKGEAWLPFLSPGRYIAVDIARSQLERSLIRMAPDYPQVEMVGVVTDFSLGLQLEGALDGSPTTFFYPGSSVGNFTPAEAVEFLADVRAQAAKRPGSCLLIGVDGKKDSAILDAAYDDALGVTAAFNRNVLLHLNRRFGFDFDHEGFAHRAFYNGAFGRVEMHLESVRDQAVTLDGRQRRFPVGERIHTENSYKYDAGEFEEMLRRAGFGTVRRWASSDVAYFVFYAA